MKSSADFSGWPAHNGLSHMIYLRVIQNTQNTLSDVIYGAGEFCLYVFEVFRQAFIPPTRLRATLAQVEFIGYESVGIVCMSAVFTGGVFSLQIGEIVHIFNSQSLIGAITCDSLAVALAPIMTGFLITGRVGASMTAEISAMKSKEQIDALAVMAVHPISYLVVPRVCACVFAVPGLTVLFLLFGSLGSYLVSIYVYFVDPGAFFENTINAVDWDDIGIMLGKSFVLGWLIGTISCYFGMKSSRGGRGIGQATILSVVSSFITILMMDALITYIDIVVLYDF